MRLPAGTVGVVDGAELVERLLVGEDDERALHADDLGGWLTRAALRDRVAARAAELGDVAGRRVTYASQADGATAVELLALLQAGAAAAPLNPALPERELAWARADAASGRARGVLFLHTSGTTGRPKAVELGAANLLASATAVGASCELGPVDTGLLVMPLFHVHGIVAGLLAPLLAGGAVAVAGRFSVSGFWPRARETGATWYTGVPTMHESLLDRADDPAAPAPAPGGSALRFARTSSAPYAGARMHAYEERFGIPLVAAYGMTEAAHQVCSEGVTGSTRRPGSVGRPPAPADVALLAADGSIATSGTGEVLVRGGGVFGGYAGNPDATAAAFVDSWFRTGDEGRVDEDGFLTLVARLKELIDRGGEKVAPAAVEEVLAEHPAVAEAAVYGVPDAHYGEEVHAAVVLHGTATATELRAFASERLAAFATPKRIRLLAALPRNPTGKVDRAALAAGDKG